MGVCVWVQKKMSKSQERKMSRTNAINAMTIEMTIFNIFVIEAMIWT